MQTFLEQNEQISMRQKSFDQLVTIKMQKKKTNNTNKQKIESKLLHAAIIMKQFTK